MDLGVLPVGQHETDGLLDGWPVAVVEADDPPRRQHLVDIPPGQQRVVEGMPAVQIREVDPKARGSQSREGVIVVLFDELVPIAQARLRDGGDTTALPFARLVWID